MKIKKVLTQQLNVLSLPEIRIEAKSNDMGLERKYSILGGVLYIDEKPVHHYFSKNMFFYEDGEEQGSIFLAHHGLTADVIIRKNGKTTLCKASSLLHYEMTYQAEGKEKKLDAAFGMGIDSSRKSYFYCGLKQTEKRSYRFLLEKRSRKTRESFRYHTMKKQGISSPTGRPTPMRF